jgi:hypothetical protein
MMRITICLFLIIIGIINPSAFSQEPLADTRKGTPGTELQVPDDKKSEMTDIFDIKGPEAFGVNPAYFRYAIYALIILLLLALIAAAIHYWKKRQKKIEEIVAHVDPDVAAYKLLDELAGLELPDGKEFYFRLSAILRNYFRGRYKIDAPEMTTEQLLPRIMKINLGHDIYQQLKTFFYSSDPIKFADIAADPDKMKNDLFFVRNFVKETTPVEPQLEDIK